MAETNEKNWEANERKWETSQPGTPTEKNWETKEVGDKPAGNPTRPSSTKATIL